MESRHSTSPLLPSRVILGIGALGFLWIVLLALFVLQGAAEAPAAEMPTETVAASNVPEAAPDVPEAAPELLAQTAPENPTGLGPVPEVAPGTEPPAAATTRPPQDTAEPILNELATFLLTVHREAAQPGFALDPVLTSYFGNLVLRMNEASVAYRVTLSAPPPGLAARQAEVLDALFRQHGLRPGILTFTSRQGPTGVDVARA